MTDVAADPTLLQTTWFALLGLVWTLYLVLGGADLGVGMLLRGRAADGGPLREPALRAIGPTWAANDVWLVVAVAGTFGAFPGWYASWTSGLYLPLVVLLLALIVRHAGIELLSHAGERGQRRWATAVVASSYALALGWGIVWAAALDGSLAAREGSGLGVLSPTTIAAGLALVALCRLQGIAFLRLRAPVAAAALGLRRAAAAALVLVIGAVLALALGADAGVALGPVGITALVGAAAAGAWLALGARRRRPGQVLAAGSLLSTAALAAVFAALFPAVIAGPGGASVAAEAAGNYTLGLMLAIALVLLPLLLAALGYGYARFLRLPEADRPTGAAGLGGLLALAARGTLGELR